MSEDQFQSVCYQWAYNTYPEIRKLLFHVPNGGSRNKIEAMKLKAMGVVAGIPDLVLIWQGIVYGFELKVGTNQQSKEQTQVETIWTIHGAFYYLIRDSLSHFQSLINNILKK